MYYDVDVRHCNDYAVLYKKRLSAKSEDEIINKVSKLFGIEKNRWTKNIVMVKADPLTLYTTMLKDTFALARIRTHKNA